ncbi:MAG: HD domain-containing protein [Candidatus Eremiobacteraeota bacterium]|nr:HD domain-containing protein [Candidatus Eremiobacteraeota bacterium]
MAIIQNLPRFAPVAAPSKAAPLAKAALVEAPPPDGLALSAPAPELTPKALRWEPAASLVNPKAEQLARGTEATWQGSACSGVAELAARYFSTTEFQALNSGSYHNFEHPLVVADAAGKFAPGLGWTPERKQFIQQVALLHDADDRTQVDSGEVKTGTPARAQVTLEWMEQQKTELSQRFGWSSEQFVEAKALVARTDFPFDDKPKAAMGTRYDGQSSVQVYQELLQQLPQEKQVEVLRDGLALRFADQAGFYANSFDMAVDSVQGLAKELNSGLAGTLKFTPTFLAGVGNDTQFDRQLADQMGLGSVELPDRERLLANWNPAMAQRFHTNARQFEMLSQALGNLPAEAVEGQLEGLKSTARAAYRLTTGQSPT